MKQDGSGPCSLHKRLEGKQWPRVGSPQASRLACFLPRMLPYRTRALLCLLYCRVTKEGQVWQPAWGQPLGGQGGLEPTAVCSQGRAPVSCQDCPLLLREVSSLLTPPTPVMPWGLLPGCREAPDLVPTEAEAQPGCEHTGPPARGGGPWALWCAWSPGQQKGGRGTFPTPGRSVRLGARGWAMAVACVIREGPESVDALPIDVAGSLSEARPGQACGQWLMPRPPGNTGGGVGTGQGWSWGSEPP